MNNCFIKFLKLQKFGSTKYERKKRENQSKNKKNLMKLRKKIFKIIFGFIQREISFSSKNVFSLAKLSAIFYHISSN